MNKQLRIGILVLLSTFILNGCTSAPKDAPPTRDPAKSSASLKDDASPRVSEKSSAGRKDGARSRTSAQSAGLKEPCVGLGCDEKVSVGLKEKCVGMGCPEDGK
jgi:hypothetical protein